MIIPIDVTGTDFEDRCFENQATQRLYQPIAVNYGDLLFKSLPRLERPLSYGLPTNRTPDNDPPFVAFLSNKLKKRKYAAGVAIEIKTNSHLIAKAIWKRATDVIYEENGEAAIVALTNNPDIDAYRLPPDTARTYRTYLEMFSKTFPHEYYVSFADNEEEQQEMESRVQDLFDYIRDDADRRAELRVLHQRQQELTPEAALEELNQALTDAQIHLDPVTAQKLDNKELVIDSDNDPTKQLALQFAPVVEDMTEPETDNSTLPPESENIALSPDAHELYQLAESYHTDLELCRGRLQQTKTDLAHERARAKTFEHMLNERTQTEETAPFTTIPKNLVDLLDIIQASFPTRIVVHKDAYRSAESFNGNLDDEWSVLLACATNLWDIIFTDNDSNRISDRFQKQTGLEFSMRETSGTMSNEKLRALRQHVYRGETITSEAHIKGRANYLRVYIWPDYESKQLVITYAGQHLDTIRTKRRPGTQSK